jgi:hypothetical protein
MKIHLIFYILLLELALNSALENLLEQIEGLDKPYNVEEILNSKYVKYILYYLIKWLGYPTSKNL